MHLQDHSASQPVLSSPHNPDSFVVGLTAHLRVTVSPDVPGPPKLKELKIVSRSPRIANTLSTHAPDEGAYRRLALKACQTEHRFPPASACYEVEDRTLPSVSSF
jgi:hypothetical protein